MNITNLVIKPGPEKERALFALTVEIPLEEDDPVKLVAFGYTDPSGLLQGGRIDPDVTLYFNAVAGLDALPEGYQSPFPPDAQISYRQLRGTHDPELDSKVLFASGGEFFNQLAVETLPPLSALEHLMLRGRLLAAMLDASVVDAGFSAVRQNGDLLLLVTQLRTVENVMCDPRERGLVLKVALEEELGRFFKDNRDFSVQAALSVWRL